MIRVAAALGMIPPRLPPPTAAQTVIDRYLWVMSPYSGWCRYAVEPGDAVEEGEVLVVIHNLFGNVLTTVHAPAAGHVLWRVTHNVVSEAGYLLGIGARQAP